MSIYLDSHVIFMLRVVEFACFYIPHMHASLFSPTLFSLLTRVVAYIYMMLLLYSYCFNCIYY